MAALGIVTQDAGACRSEAPERKMAATSRKSRKDSGTSASAGQSLRGSSGSMPSLGLNFMVAAALPVAPGPARDRAAGARSATNGR